MLVLSRSSYPVGFPQSAKVLYISESKQLLVQYDLPALPDVIPAVRAYKYIKANDSVTETSRPESQCRSLYATLVAQTVLRCLNEVFHADRIGHIETIVLNAHVSAIDPGTGHRVKPCLVTVRTTKDTFRELDLSHVEPSACLRTLNASVSKNPAELAPVRPILEFNMTDPRFIEEADVLSTLDQRRNLMDLSPGEFESLITNLFEKMGLETRQTQASRDGGVDCVAYDPRPIFGGKVVIQAKRYKNVVGVSAVRDLFGTMQNEGASKGILVTTSGYGKASFEFAAGKPIELLSGSNLLYLLTEHAGIEARIVMPEEWIDPAPDRP
jgi:restriction system protein